MGERVIAAGVVRNAEMLSEIEESLPGRAIIKVAMITLLNR